MTTDMDSFDPFVDPMTKELERFDPFVVAEIERQQTDRGNRASFDIENPFDALVKSVKMDLGSLPFLSSECSIYRVPEGLRHIKEKAYTPQLVSIGPLHYGREGLKAMEEHKMRYLKALIERIGESLEFFVGLVKEKEARLRGFYAETIPFSREEFVKIILVDAAFLVEVLLRSHEEKQRSENNSDAPPRSYSTPQKGENDQDVSTCSYLTEPQDENDPIFNKSRMIQDVWPDMMMLENQVPFFILEDLYNILPCPSRRLSITELSFSFFTMTGCLTRAQVKRISSASSAKGEHFVDLLRHIHVPSKAMNKRTVRTSTTPSMTNLNQAGVQFQVGSSNNLLDIKFAKGILEMPKLTIGPGIELPIRNIVAFEHCHRLDPYMNDFVIIMDRLVNTSKDVDLLAEHGILVNLEADSNEAAYIINKLAAGSCMRNNFYFASLSNKLEAYCSKSWHKWQANLKQNYFNTPWAIISFVAAFFLLSLTLIQTVSSVISIS
ncbi:hypothetical protein CJ030_MR8G020613 [Morella rubra]|uniref:Uncharacterized protein n=1 Tax=Morella rubra TaxID=262757 RepID=A0A6A1UZT2_9ROSI|nr:hypothetical protein CJ030_MR8G020613 [Morella rubra]